MDTTRAIERLDIFATYQDGWHYGEGEAYSAATIAHARRMIAQFAEDAEGDEGIDTFPGLNGDIGVSLYIGGQAVSVYVCDAQITEVGLND